MYVIVGNGHIFGFGLTPEKAMDHFLDGLLSYDGPRLDTRPCSPALYRQLQTLDRKGKVLPRTMASWASGEIRRSEFQNAPLAAIGCQPDKREQAQRHRMDPPFP